MVLGGSQSAPLTCHGGDVPKPPCSVWICSTDCTSSPPKNSNSSCSEACLPSALWVAVTGGESDRMAVRTMSFFHASPVRDMLSTSAASVQHLHFSTMFSLHFLLTCSAFHSFLSSLCGLVRVEEGKFSSCARRLM